MFLFEKGVFLVSCMMWLITVRVFHHWDIAQLITNVSDVHSYNTRSSHSKNTGIQEPFFLNNSMLAYREWYVAHTNQITASGYVSRTNQSVVLFFGLRGVEISTKYWRDSWRTVRKMESSFRMRNVGFSVFLMCILPRFMRNTIILDRCKIFDYLQ